ncbi:MAG: PKD domain-containing protein [Bacteroidia bacterium]|nr:PKD domain-containing protein [Bacteroidia bacterium]
MKKILTLLSFVLVGFAGKAQLSVSYTQTSGCAPLSTTINFFEPSAASYNIKIYSYYGGNVFQTNTASAFLNYTFTNGGYYSVEVYAVNAGGFEYDYNYSYVNVFGIDANFSTSASQGACPGDQVYLNIPTFSAGGGNATYDWDLGNGTTYSQIPYGYVYGNYPSVGNYTVSVNVNVPGCGNYSLQDTIVVSTASTNVPYFSTYFYPNDSVCPNDPVYIGGPNTGYTIYDYGDGTTYSGTQNQEHAYTHPGTYYVTVTAINGCGNSYTDVDTLHIVGGLPNYYANNLSFSISDSIVCPNSEVYLYSNNGLMTNIKWNISPTDSSTIPNPQVSFPVSGIYPIKLTVYNGCGVPASVTEYLYVVDTISASPFTLDMTDSICPGSPFLLDVNVNNDHGLTFTYDFGDTTYSAEGAEFVGHVYTTPGTYTVSVSYLNGCGNSAVGSQTIYVGPNAGTQHTVMFGAPQNESCPGDSTFLMIYPGGGSNTYVVDFGDGSPVTSTASILYGPQGLTYNIYKHVYPSIGTYTASVNVTSACGGGYTDSTQMIVSNSSPLNDAGFFYDDQKYYCLGDPISFYGYGASQFEWDFGDGTGVLQTNGILQPVTHTYSEPGYYTISTIVTNNCGLKDTSFDNVNVPDTRINIVTNSVSSSCGQSNGKAIAIASGGTLPYQFNWTNGDVSFLADSISAGIYVVNIEDKNGCKNFAIATVSDVQAPTILINNVINASCNNGADGVIDITVIGSSGPYTYVWSNGKTSEDVNNLVAGPYEVIVTDANGCIATKSINVDEPDAFIVSFSPTQPDCGSANGMLVANVLGNSGPYNFIWQTGLNSSTLSGITAGTYSLVVVDSKGCLKQITTTLNNQGAPALGIDSVGPLNCGSGGASIFTTGIGANPLSYSWTNGVNTFSTADISGLPGGSYTLTCTDVNGCQSFKVVEITETKPIGNPVCLVTVDTTTYTNKVIWEEVTQPDLASYNIYRESSQAGLYYLVGNVDKDSLHQYIDPVADPNIRPWRYKITSVSDCGTESEQSDFHKTIHLTINKGLTDSTYNLIWDNYEGQNTYTTFYIWIYKNTTGWVKMDSIAKTDHSYTSFVNGFSALTDLYYFVEAGPLVGCDPQRSIVNTSRSNIKQIVAGPDTTGSIGIMEQDLSDNFVLYPNPTKGIITIKTTDDWGKTKIEITNVLGQVLYAENATISTKIIDISNFANGIYFVRVYKGDKAISRKIMLSK